MQRGHRWGRKHERDKRDRRDVIGIYCRCPLCGHRLSNREAVPCSSVPCPQCGAPMVETKWR